MKFWPHVNHTGSSQDKQEEKEEAKVKINKNLKRKEVS